MERLTHKRENGIKRGYWSPNKKQELVDSQDHYKELEESHNAKASKKFRTPVYSVMGYLKKTGADVKRVMGDE